MRSAVAPRALSKEVRLRGQVGLLVDHIYIICDWGIGLRSEIKKRLFTSNSLKYFLTQKNVFFSKRKKMYLAAKKIMVGFATGPHLRNFDWVRAKLWEDLSSIVHQTNVHNYLYK